MKTPLEFFTWAFENKPKEQQIVVCVANKYTTKEGSSHPYFSAFNCSTPAEAEATAKKYCNQKKDVYYTLTTYTDNIETVPNTGRQKVSRLAKHAKMSRIIGFDIDCGDNKPYSNWKEGMTAALPVLASLGLTKEQYTFIKSGGGLHGYLRLPDFIDKTTWIRLTSALKAYFLSTDLEIDKSKLTDPAMLLRPIGTNNYKLSEPRPVELLHKATEDVTVEKLETLLADFLPMEQNELKAIEDLPNIEELPSALIDGNLITQNSFKPTHISVQTNCQQMGALSRDSNVSEALWYCALGVASCTESPKEAAIAWSKNCATYNEAKTLAKMAQWIASTTGPATCAKINSINPQGCVGCAFASKVKTPLQTASAPVTVIETAKAEVIELPKGYRIVDECIVKSHDDGVVNLDLHISDYLMYLEGVARFYDIRKPVTYLRLQVKLPRTGWTPIEIELNILTGAAGKGGESFAGIMGGIGVALHKKNMILLQTYVMDCYRHFQAHRDVGKVCTQMGWTPEGNFIYGLKEYKGKRVPPELVTPQGATLQVLTKGMEPKGRKVDWLSAIRVLAHEGLELHAFGYLLAYGSPLFKFSGLDGCTINFYSENTGSGKTTAPRLAMSVYGSPKVLGGGKVDSDSHLFAKLGGLNNIPSYSDEMTEMPAQRVSELLYSVSEGQGKGRADREGEMRESKRWSLIFFMSSNKSMYEKLDAHTKSAAGQKARLIELNLDTNEIMKKHGRAVNLLIEDNYGHGAIDYINEIVEMHQQGELDMQVRMAAKEFSEHFAFDFTGEERFIESVLACTWFGAKIALNLGLCPGVNQGEVFNLDKIFNAVLLNIKRNRLKLAEAVEDSEAVINAMLARYPDSWVKIMNEGTKESGAAPRGKCIGRLEIFYKDVMSSFIPTHGIISIGCKAFEEFCRETDRPYHRYIEEFRAHKFRNFSEKSIAVTSGVKYNVDGQPATPMRFKCFTMDLPMTAMETFKKEHKIDPYTPIFNNDISFNYGENIL